MWCNKRVPAYWIIKFTAIQVKNAGNFFSKNLLINVEMFQTHKHAKCNYLLFYLIWWIYLKIAADL